MSPEEFARIKEQEKAHLREMKRLQEQVADANRKGRLASAFESIAGALTQGDDEREALTRQLHTGAAQAEARMEIALDAEAERQKAAESRAAQAQFEKEQEAARARSLVERLRAEMGAGADAPAAASGARSSDAPAAPAAGKTFGRAEPPADAGSEAPAKTFGRS